MRSYAFDFDGGTYEFDAPDDMTEQEAYRQAELMAKSHTPVGRFEQIKDGLQSGKPVPSLLQQVGNFFTSDNPEDAPDIYRVGMGASDIVRGGAQFLNETIGRGTGSYDPEYNKEVADIEQAYRDRLAPEGYDVLRIAGNVAGGIPASAAGPAGMVAGGAATALTQPVTNNPNQADYWKQKGIQAGMGGILGAVMKGILPNAQFSDDVQAVLKDGGRPTVGQAIGGLANRLEQKATSIPIVGDMIARSRAVGRDSFNQAELGRVYKAIGQNAPEGVGTDAIEAAGNAVSGAYQDAISGLSDDLAARAFNRAEVNAHPRLQKAFSSMSERQIREFNRVIDSLGAQPEAAASRYKIMDSDLGTHANRYMKSSLASDKQIGGALKDYQSVVRERLMAEAPANAAGIRAADSAWNQLKGIVGAGKRASISGGVFTPGQLVNTVKNTRGRGAAEQLSRAQQAQRVFGDTYPDSGTAGRLIQNIAAGGAGIGGVTGVIHPAAAAGIAGSALAYSPAVQRAIVWYMQQGNSLVDAIKKATAAAGAGQLSDNLMQQK